MRSKQERPDSTGIHSTALTTPIPTEYAGVPPLANPAVTLTFTFAQRFVGRVLGSDLSEAPQDRFGVRGPEPQRRGEFDQLVVLLLDGVPS